MSTDEATKKSLLDSNQYFKKVFDLVPQKAYFDADSNEKIISHRVESVPDKKTGTGAKHVNDKHKLKKAKFDPHQPFKTSELQQILPKLDHEAQNDEKNEAVLANGHCNPTATTDGKKIVKDNTKRTRPNAHGGTNGGVIDGVEFEAIHSASSKELVHTKTKSIDSKLNNCTKQDGSANSAKAVDVSSSTDTDCRSAERNNVCTEETTTANFGDGVERQKKGNKKQKATNISNKSTNSEISTSSSSVPSPGSVATQPKLNSDQLREKLRTRISELQAKRRRGMTAEEFLESKKLRRKESKLKLKQKRKEAKKLKLSVEKQIKNSQNKLNGVSEVAPTVDSNSTNNNNNIVFSKFEFSEQAKKPKERKQKKPKSYRELYEKVTKDKEKLEELKQTDAEKAKKIAEKTAWRKAMEQSKGVKVKDNPDLIKKSMKKEEKLKKRTHKKWEERTAVVAEQQQKRQEKRQKNIQAKKQSNQDRKMKLAKKKGRMISGF